MQERLASVRRVLAGTAEAGMVGGPERGQEGIGRIDVGETAQAQRLHEVACGLINQNDQGAARRPALEAVMRAAVDLYKLS